MPNYFEGHLVSEGLKYGVVVGRFNEFITSKLLSGALDAFKRHGVQDSEVDVAWVPGAFEIPLIAQKWRRAANMTLSLHWERLFVAQRHIMIMCATKWQKEWQPLTSKRACLRSLVWLQRRILNKRLNVLVRRLVTKVGMLPRLQLKWRT